MTEKTTNWTPEELEEIRRERRGAWSDAYESRIKGPIPFWDWQGHECPIDEHCVDCVNQAHDEAAAVAGGMLLMALAIQRNYPHLFPCGLHSPPYGGGPCMRCGYDDGRRWGDEEPDP